jgi:hypothetical protein
VRPQWCQLPSHVNRKARLAGFEVEFTADGLEVRLRTTLKTACVRVARQVLSCPLCCATAGLVLLVSRYGNIGLFLSSQAKILDPRREKGAGAAQMSLAEEGRIPLHPEGVLCRVLAVNLKRRGSGDHGGTTRASRGGLWHQRLSETDPGSSTGVPDPTSRRCRRSAHSPMRAGDVPMTPDPLPRPTYRGCPLSLVRLRKPRRCMRCLKVLPSGELAWRRSVASLIMQQSDRLCVPCQAL